MIDEGYIKFDCRWTEGPPPPAGEVAMLRRWRDHLHRLGLIGVYPDGAGYGNISARRGDGMEFIISGTRTGEIAELAPEHFTVVTAFDIDGNSLACEGTVRASSESLTHAAIYRTAPGAGAVIHVHHLRAWEALLGRIPTTDPEVPYGTPAMAHEIERLFRRSDLPTGRVAAMGGHREGLIAFGADLDEAGEALLSALGAFIQEDR